MLLLVYGTRPEWIKIKPIIKKLKEVGAKYRVLFTGQHTTLVDGEYDYKLDVKDKHINRLNNVFANILLDRTLEFINPDYVLVQGDTATVCAIALKYYNLGSKIIHLEAGLRTYDLENPYPEEAYRQMVSRIADVNLCPTESNYNNLVTEKCSGKMYVVGNTVLDNIAHIKTSYKNQVLITMHRRENHCILDSWFKEINKIAKIHKAIEFVLPIHPNPNVLKHKHLLENVKVVEPMNHSELINFLKDCKLVITDSGGIQEEATFLQKKIIVCRKESERKENNGHLFLCKEPEDMEQIFNHILQNFEINEPCPYGDGNSSEKIIEIFQLLGVIS